MTPTALGWASALSWHLTDIALTVAALGGAIQAGQDKRRGRSADLRLLHPRNPIRHRSLCPPASTSVER